MHRYYEYDYLITCTCNWNRSTQGFDLREDKVLSKIVSGCNHAIEREREREREGREREREGERGREGERERARESEREA